MEEEEKNFARCLGVLRRDSGEQGSEHRNSVIFHCLTSFSANFPFKEKFLGFVLILEIWVRWVNWLFLHDYLSYMMMMNGSVLLDLVLYEIFLFRV